MLRLCSYDIVFQEIPGEVTLALNLSGCPNSCPGCHSPHLQEDTGETLDERLLSGLVRTYGCAVTCVCFMGGDADPHEVSRLAGLVRSRDRASRPGPGHGSDQIMRHDTARDPEQERGPGRRLKTGWYSGKAILPPGFDTCNFDYIKLGPYIEKLGGLDSPTTNQRFYKIESDQLTDLTFLFRRQ